MDRRNCDPWGGGIFQAVNTKVGDWGREAGRDFFQVMNFETGVVSIKIAVLRGSSVK